MKEIIINENIKIINDKSTYMIKFKYSSYLLINSLIKTRIIQGGSTDELYKTVRFKADSVITLTEYLEEKKRQNGKKCLLVSDIAKLIRTLTTQLEYLILLETSTILGYNPSDIIVINDEKFAYLGSENISKIDEENENTIVTYPFAQNDFFLSPELLKVKELPSHIHYKTAYFSLGLLLIYALLGNNDFYNDYLNHNDPKQILNVLDNHPIKNTRIYWLLSRCLVEDPFDRSIIMI